MPADSQSIDDLIRQAMERIRSVQSPIESTYRVQFHAGFTFSDATKIVPYLADLGITHLYASPYLRAQPGSTHGYDVIDHCRLNPELGTTEDYESLLAALKKHGMSHIADIVPNHVGVATNDNVWWNDVLENGPASIYANYFDINWTGSPVADLNGRLLMPVLGSMYGSELEKGNLRLAYKDGSFFVTYYDRKFPISPKTYSMILDTKLPILKGIASGQEIKRRLADAATRDKSVADSIAAAVKSFNGTPGDPSSFGRLDDLLRNQCFRLAYWKTAPDEINYRRFFDVNSLAALAMERPEVFEATHAFILNLLAQNKIAGLRIDHPDGLYDPAQYFNRLQTQYVLAVARQIADPAENWEILKPQLLDRLQKDPSAKPLYVLGEKILALDESLENTWSIDGTSGYDFLNMTNGLFVDTSAADRFTEIYHNWIGDDTSFEELAYQKKKAILQTSLASELNMLSITLKKIAGRSRDAIDFSLHGLQIALQEVIACFPVYRSYISAAGFSETDRGYVTRAIEAAIARNPKIEPAIFQFISEVILADAAKVSSEELINRRRLAGKFQQLTSPVTAKGIEDTAFYIYNRLLSLNEVGGNPSRFGVEPQHLHAFFEQRQQDWPRTMNTLSTHDTKRSEDVRARLNALSEMPDQWHHCLNRWSHMNTSHRDVIDGLPAPDRNEEYAIYQTLLGAWPIDQGHLNTFEKRIQDSMLKFMREAKVHTTWADPNKPREEAVQRFINAILDPARGAEFLSDFLQFQRKLSQLGMMNSLSQTLIKLTAPGVPDTYQGNELWDFSLVDPDNRRPVDFNRRIRSLAEISKTATRDWKNSFESSDIKLAVHRAALKLRRQFPGLFTHGQYVPLETTGVKARHLFAFARIHEKQIAITAIPRLLSGLAGDLNVWGDTSLILPEFAHGRTWRNVFTDASPAAETPNLSAQNLFANFPVSLLISQ